MAKNELFTDKLAKLKKPLAFIALLIFLLFDYQLIKSIFWKNENQVAYVQNELMFGSISNIGAFIFINFLVLFFAIYLFQKKK